MEGVVDGSVGTIVWVRRRNGSWWPGRILGQDELSASHLMSPRSGTPVKLLGREDASVDWYNLEKSKRVKAFRCGEFDACIGRAEASQGIPIKKREKYARREDAILHALELEKQQIEMKHQKLGITSNVVNNKTSGARRREFNSFPSYDYMGDEEPGVHSKFANHKSQMFSRKAALSHEEEDNLYVHKVAKSKKASSTEQNPEALPRMRGQQDFGLRIAPPKKKFSQSTWETSYKSVHNHVGVHSNSGHMIGTANHVGDSKTSPSIKRKRSQGLTSDDSLVKNRDRRRPLVKVLQSSAQLPVSHSFLSGYDSGAVSMPGEMDNMLAICRAKRSKCVYLPAGSNDCMDNGGYPSEQMPGTEMQFRTGNYLGHSGALSEDDTSSATTEETESDSSETDSSEPDMDENGLTDTSQILLPGSRNCDPPDIHISENFGDLIDSEKPHHGYMPLAHPQDQMMDASADVGVSKWHIKGKRNVRHLPKRHMEPMDGRILSNSANRFVKGTTYENRGSSLKVRSEPFSKKAAGRSLYHEKVASDYAFDGGDILEREGRNQLRGYGNQRYSFALQADKDHGRSGRSQNSFNDSDSDSHLLFPSLWEADDPSSHMRRAYWDEADECYNPVYAGAFGDEMDLLDVDLKVQASTYQGEHVPLVSLMSRLNGKAIIGHPVQIEILEDGSTGQLLAKYDADLDESAPPSAVWKTARRSVMLRVPRSNPAASALEGEDNDLLQDSDPEGKPSPKKAYSSYLNHQASLARKSVSHSRRPLVAGKFQRKPLKRVNLSSQKTRTLSSLANEHRRDAENGGGKHSRQSDLVGGLIRPDGAAPLVTCVPVKVVFSRILEAVGRPSTASAHRARMASPAVRGPP